MSQFDPNFKSIKHYALVGQKIIISNSQNEILLLQRSEKSGAGGKWSFPGGALESGESSERGLLREVEEETQISVNYPRPFYIKTYKNNDNETVVIIAYRAFYRGGKVLLNWEHDDFVWTSKERALRMDLTPDAHDVLSKWQPKEMLPEMTSKFVLRIYSELEKRNIKIWLDGGWGVDALLKKQTRPHDDLDIVIQKNDVASAVNYLANLGFVRLTQDDATDWNFVLSDDEGHLIDFHVISVDKNGNGVYGPIENGDVYDNSALSGLGVIQKESVRCLSPEYQIQSHSGYKLREHDFHDVKSLCDSFGIALPQEYT